MQPLDATKRPAVHDPALNHIGLWVDDLAAAVAWLGAQGMRFTLSEPWSALLLDDARVIHESTPIQPLDPALPAHRDTLVLTFRQRGFQGPVTATTP